MTAPDDQIMRVFPAQRRLNRALERFGNGIADRAGLPDQLKAA